MEMSDGLDFETWNATVRSLSSAVDRLDQTARLFAAPAWAEPLIAALEELNLHFRRFDEANLWLPRPGDPKGRSLTPEEPGEAASQPESTEPLPTDAEVSERRPEDPGPVTWDREPPVVPVRFGDPDAIARYGRRRPR